MTTSTLGFTPVAAPAPTRPVINLLAAARTPQGEGVRWGGGTVYESLSCGSVTTSATDPCGPNGADGRAVVRAGVDAGDAEGRRVEAWPVYAEASYDCIALPALIDSYRDAALATLDAELPRAVEHELWTGAIARLADAPNRYLIDPTRVEVLNGGAAVKPAAALGLLEDALGDVYSGVGLIHLNRHAQVYLPTLTRDGRIIETRVGNRVVPGVGYPGVGPADEDHPNGTAPGANQEWVYITPMVTVRLGDTEVPDRAAVDPQTNRARIIARQPFEVSWDGCAAAFAVLMQTVVEATP